MELPSVSEESNHIRIPRAFVTMQMIPNEEEARNPELSIPPHLRLSG